MLYGVIDNQVTAKVFGKVGHLSNFMLRMIAKQALQDSIGALAFTAGRTYEVDLVGIVKDAPGKSDGSFRFEYFDNVDEVVASKKTNVTAQNIESLLLTDDQSELRRCLNDFQMALANHLDSPFYCYRALESVRRHLGRKAGLSDKAKQWEHMRTILSISEAEIYKVKGYSDPLRHGAHAGFNGSEWRWIISTTWDTLERYIKLLLKERSSAQQE
jgi:hypothetical protein